MDAPVTVNVQDGPGMRARAPYRHHNAVLEDHFLVASHKTRNARPGWAVT